MFLELCRVEAATAYGPSYFLCKPTTPTVPHGISSCHLHPQRTADPHLAHHSHEVKPCLSMLCSSCRVTDSTANPQTQYPGLALCHPVGHGASCSSNPHTIQLQDYIRFLVYKILSHQSIMKSTQLTLLLTTTLHGWFAAPSFVRW